MRSLSTTRIHPLLLQKLPSGKSLWEILQLSVIQYQTKLANKTITVSNISQSTSESESDSYNNPLISFLQAIAQEDIIQLQANLQKIKRVYQYYTLQHPNQNKLALDNSKHAITTTNSTVQKVMYYDISQSSTLMQGAIPLATHAFPYGGALEEMCSALSDIKHYTVSKLYGDCQVR